MQTGGIKTWFDGVVANSDMKTEIVSFSDPKNEDWEITENGIVRKDKKYYEVVLVKTSKGSEYFHKPMIHPFAQDGSDAYGLLFLLKIGDRYLVQAKTETGNQTSGHVVLTTTIQSSYKNLASGEIAYADLLEKADDKLRAKSVPQDAGMLYHKNNRYIFAETESSEVEVLPNFFLATREDIAVLAKEGLVSEHLLQMFGLLWTMKF